MTKAEFIAEVEAKENFRKWATTPVKRETLGEVEHWQGRAFVNTNDGVNVVDVWFMVDSTADEANWQNGDSLDVTNNKSTRKLKLMTKYLETTFEAYFLTDKVDLDNNWLEAEVFEASGDTLTRTSVVVFKDGKTITHKVVA